jgi:pyrroloquinoline quinone biosynthesis protein B
LLRILVLGSAAGGGYPQWNSNSESCNKARRGEAQARTQSSLAVTADGERWFLLNASPDLRQQINDHPDLHPRHGIRHSPIVGVILTNADVDHVVGLLTLRESQPLAVYGSERVLSALARNNIFDVLNPESVERRPLCPEKPFEPRTRDGTPVGLRVEAFDVPGKVALYLEDPAAGKGFGTKPGDTIGLKVSHVRSGRSFFYIPGCAAMPDNLAKRLREAELVFFDGTLFRNDEMIACGEGTKTGERMGHMSMSGPSGVMAAFAGLNVKRRVFIHINNTNPVLLDDSPERREVERAGWEVAWDGMTIEL